MRYSDWMLSQGVKPNTTHSKGIRPILMSALFLLLIILAGILIAIGAFSGY